MRATEATPTRDMDGNDRAERATDGRRDRDSLIGWVIKQAGHDSPELRPRWFYVQKIFGLGATSAARLCVEYGHDPDEVIGGDQ